MKKISSSKLDSMLWALVVILVITAVFINYYYLGELAWSLRFASWIILTCGLVGLVALTAQGKKIWSFIKEARIELLKVVWPTREETIKTTAVVAALVFAMSAILWVVDSFLLWIFSWFTK